MKHPKLLLLTLLMAAATSFSCAKQSVAPATQGNQVAKAQTQPTRGLLDPAAFKVSNAAHDRLNDHLAQKLAIAKSLRDNYDKYLHVSEFEGVDLDALTRMTRPGANLSFFPSLDPKKQGLVATRVDKGFPVLLFRLGDYLVFLRSLPRGCSSQGRHISLAKDAVILEHSSLNPNYGIVEFSSIRLIRNPEALAKVFILTREEALTLWAQSCLCEHNDYENTIPCTDPDKDKK